MTTYSHIVPDIYSDFCIKKHPGLPDNIFLCSGLPTKAPSQPLVYLVSSTAANPPPHFESETVPVMSRLLLGELHGLGIDNLQTFEAVLRNPDSGEEWPDYAAVNVVGLISCASPRSTGTVLATQVGGIPLMLYQELLIVPALARGTRLFRLAESPQTLLMADDVIDRLFDRAPPGGWGMSVFPVQNLTA